MGVTTPERLPTDWLPIRGRRNKQKIIFTRNTDFSFRTKMRTEWNCYLFFSSALPRENRKYSRTQIYTNDYLPENR